VRGPGSLPQGARLEEYLGELGAGLTPCPARSCDKTPAFFLRSYRLCYLRGPAGISGALAAELG
jgi:hypothetical protein